MKIRTDFVTNSSSSSFIVGFMDSNNIEEELRNNFPDEYTEEQFQIVCSDCEHSIDKVPEESLIELIRSNAEWDAAFVLRDFLYNRKKMRLKELSDYIYSEKGQHDIEEIAKDEIEEFKNNLKEYNHFSVVEYSDNDGDFYDGLEFELMPKVGNVIKIINQH